MKHKLIKTENYLLVVDESEIKEGDYVLTNLMEIVVFNKPSTPSLYKKIIAHLPINKIIAHLPINAPILEGVPLLPPLEDDVEKLAQKYVEDEVKPDIEARGYNQDLRIGIYGGSVTGFIDGYNKAKKKYKYTEDDLRKAIRMCKGEFTIDEIIQSLQQPKYPVAFECKIEVCVFGNHTHYDPKIEDYVKPKTTTNSQGQTQLVGTYIYE
jgi:hypothetical protein